MLNATIVLFAWMTFKSAGVGVCCKFRSVLSGMGDVVNDSSALLWSPLLWLPSVASTIENSIKFWVKSPFVSVLSMDFDLDFDFDLTFGMATAFFAVDAASDTRPLRWMDAIDGWRCWWWWSPFTATAGVVAATAVNFAGFVPLFVLWLLLLMVLLLLFIIGGWDSVECRPCSNMYKKKKEWKKNNAY